MWKKYTIRVLKSELKRMEKEVKRVNEKDFNHPISLIKVELPMQSI